LKEICDKMGLLKKGNKKDLIERILSHQAEERKNTLKLKERKEKWKEFGFFKGNDTSAASSWNLFKRSTKATPIPLPAFDDEDTNAAIQASIQDQQKKIPLMKKISQTFSNGVKTLKHKASKRFSAPSAAQQGSSITPTGSSKKPSVDIIVLSSELDELDIVEEPQSDNMIPCTMPSGPSTQSTLFPELTTGQIKGLMDVEAIPDELMEDVAAGLFVNAFEDDDSYQSSGYQSGYWDSENEYWPRTNLMEKTDEKKFYKLKR